MKQEQLTSGFHVAALDIGGMGRAETVLYVRDGDRIVHEKVWPTMQDEMRLMGFIVHELNQYRGTLAAVFVDSLGHGGPVASYLAQEGFPVVRVNNAKASDRKFNDTKFANVRAEDAYRLRIVAQAGRFGGRICKKALAQLTKIKFFYRPSDNALTLEPKKNLDDTLDYADGLMMVYRPVGMSGKSREPTTRHSFSSGKKRNKDKISAL